LNNTTTTVAQGTLLTDIPGTPVIEEKQISPRLTEVEVPSSASDLPEPPKVDEPETEPTIPLPVKLTRQKSAARGWGKAKVTSPLHDEADGLKDGPAEPGEAETTIRLSDRKRRGGSAVLADAESTTRLPHRAIKQQNRKAQGLAASTLKLPFLRKGARAQLEQDLQISFEDTFTDDQDDEEIAHHGTWQKVVEHKTTYKIPAVTLATSTKQQREPGWFAALMKRRGTRSFFWLSSLVLIALLLSGAFGIAASFGRAVQKAVAKSPPVLLASPTTVALGGIVTLRGTHFTPNEGVMFGRDGQTPLLDTSGENVISTDAQGLFSDTFVVDPAWLSGTHTLSATDLGTHKQAVFPLIVTGKNGLQGPPHLLLSSSSLDLGSGDETTNASKLLAISNAGGGIATWQASSSESWLQITPSSGSISSGKHMSVIVAVDRSALAPGSYEATINFTSNTGESVLTVDLKVTALQASHQAILQVSPATLTFNGVASGAASGERSITISNPGVLPLTWGANVSGSSWLWVAPAGGTIAAGAAQQVTVGTTTNRLASGVYRGSITFANQGSQPVQDSPQSVYVSLTVAPACTLTLSASSLSFTGQHGGAAPVAKALSVGAAQGCAKSQSWSVSASTSSGGNWLVAGASKGTTPSTLGVSATTTGLAPGTYKGTLTFTSSVGSKMVSVSLTVTPAPCVVSGTSAVALQGTAGQASAVSQNASISASGDCQGTLSWSSATSGGSWLSAPSSGTFTSSTAVNVRADLSNLSAGTYYGTVKVTVVDSATNQTVGTITITVTLTAQPPTPPATPCTLLAPSPGELDFTAKQGSDPATPTASFTISVTGSCSGDITITPSVGSAGSGWLSITGPVTIASGSSAAFTVTVSAASQKVGTYSSGITLTASNGIDESPRGVTVTLTVQ
jgi:hypothetical protein